MKFPFVDIFVISIACTFALHILSARAATEIVLITSPDSGTDSRNPHAGVVSVKDTLYRTSETGAADGATPEGDYGDVAYADPGYQDDSKPRYPVDTERHIRAAWSYINKQHNQSMYTPDQLARIKSRIIAAWKRKIDPDGPPSAE